MVSSLHTKPSSFIILSHLFIWNSVSFFILLVFLDRSWLLTISIQPLITLSILSIYIFFILEKILLFLFRHYWQKAIFINGNVIWLWRLNPRTKTIFFLAHFLVLHQQIQCMKLGSVAITWWCHASLVPWVLLSNNLMWMDSAFEIWKDLKDQSSHSDKFHIVDLQDQIQNCKQVNSSISE